MMAYAKDSLFQEVNKHHNSYQVQLHTSDAIQYQTIFFQPQSLLVYKHRSHTNNTYPCQQTVEAELGSNNDEFFSNASFHQRNNKSLNLGKHHMVSSQGRRNRYDLYSYGCTG